MNKYFGLLLLSIFGLINVYLGFWYLIVKIFYKIDLSVLSLIRFAILEGMLGKFRIISVSAIFTVFCVGFFVFLITRGASRATVKTIRGKKLLCQEDLYRLAKNRCEKKPNVFLGEVPFPDYLHGYHTLVHGPTGSGKTTALYGLIKSIQKRNERMIVLDPNGDYYSRFGKDEDILINPFDRRSVLWDPFNDVRTELDADGMALALLPPLHSRDAKWDDNARPLLAHCITACQRHGQGSMVGLLEILNDPTSEIQSFLSTPYLPGYFNEGATRALGSVLFTLGTRLQMFRHIISGDFSFEKWKIEGKGNLFLTWKSNQLQVLIPFYTACLEVTLRSLMSDAQKRPTWVLIDEFGQFGQLASIIGAVTFGRNQGIRVVIGVQSTSQIEATYGSNDARTIQNNLSSTLILGAAHHDHEHTKRLAESFGEVEVIEKQFSNPTSPKGVGSYTLVRRFEQLVLPQELSSLPLGFGYLKLARDLPAARIRIPDFHPKVTRPGFVSRDARGH